MFAESKEPERKNERAVCKDARAVPRNSKGNTSYHKWMATDDVSPKNFKCTRLGLGCD